MNIIIKYFKFIKYVLLLPVVLILNIIYFIAFFAYHISDIIRLIIDVIMEHIEVEMQGDKVWLDEYRKNKKTT